MGLKGVLVLSLMVIGIILIAISYGMLRGGGTSHLDAFIPISNSNNGSQTTQNAYYKTIKFSPSGGTCTSIPCSYFNDTNLTFEFRTLNGSVEEWDFPYSTYGQYNSSQKFVPILILNSTVNGKALYTYDYSGLVTPSLFANVIGGLTDGRTAPEFVKEVFNFREQLTTYSLVFGNASEYPSVILENRTGDCKDFAVLMASMLEAGNIQADYGMKIQLLYMDYPNATSPNVVNHLVINVVYKNGTSQIMESTGGVLDPYKSVNGWYFNLECNSTSCSPLTSCPSGEVLGSDGQCHAECGNSSTYCSSGAVCYSGQCISCPSGYTIGSDGQCHAECGNSSTYCSSGAVCYSGQCVSCNSGYVVGLDGACYQACGSSGYCQSGSYCYNDSCISCPSGYSIGTDGKCYRD